MAALQKTVNSVGNFLIREQWRDRNWCRADAAVNLTTPGPIPFEVGEVVGRNGANPTDPFARLVSGLTNQTEFAIIVDERVSDPVFFNHVVSTGFGTNPTVLGKVTPNWKADTVTLAVLVRGDAMVRKDGLTFGGTTGGDKDVVLAALKAKGIVIVDQLVAKYSTDRMKAFRGPDNAPV